MHHEHQAGFAKPFGNWKPLLGSERTLIKRFFQLDFAATSRSAGDAFGHECSHDSIPGPV